jgi:hypothetical protein
MWLERYNHNQVKIFRETKHTYCKKKAVSTRKFTIAVICGCRFCFYLVRFGKKCDVLQKLSTAKEQLRMHTQTRCDKLFLVDLPLGHMVVVVVVVEGLGFMSGCCFRRLEKSQILHVTIAALMEE